MNLADFITAVSDAVSLLAAYPGRWLAVVVVFLIAVESLMFIPYVGFVIKMAVAGVLVPQVVALFAAAAQGQPPNPVDLVGALLFPSSTQAVLAAAALLPFAVGLCFLYAKGGAQAIQFFFGNILKSELPPARLFEQFKYAMQLVALPFTFLAGAVVIEGRDGTAALSVALVAAMENWLPVVLLALFALAFEWSSAQLAALLPKAIAVSAGVLMLVAFMAVTFAVTYTVSAQVFAQSHG